MVNVGGIQTSGVVDVRGDVDNATVRRDDGEQEQGEEEVGQVICLERFFYPTVLGPIAETC